MNQKQQILDIYKRKMRQVRQLGNNKGVEKEKNLMQDILNETVIKLLKYAEKINIENPEHLFNKTMKNVTLDKVRSFNTTDQYLEFNSETMDILKDNVFYQDEYQSYKEMLVYILDSLNKKQRVLFCLYHVKAFSMEKIAAKQGTNKMDVCREIKKLNAKLHRLKIKELYRVDFVAPCGIQDKKQGKMPEYRPPKNDAEKIVNKYNETVYLYQSDYINPIDYIPMDKEQREDNFIDEYGYKIADMNMNHLRIKPVKDNISEIVTIDNGSGLEYKKIDFNRGVLGVNHKNGCAYTWGKLGRPNYNKDGNISN